MRCWLQVSIGAAVLAGMLQVAGPKALSPTGVTQPHHFSSPLA